MYVTLFPFQIYVADSLYEIITGIPRRDSTYGRVVALYPADPGSNPVISMLQRALRLSVSAGRQTQLIMNRSWSRTLIVALLHWLDYKTLQLLLLLLYPATWNKG